MYKGGALCSLVKNKPLAILHLFMVSCQEIKNNDNFYKNIVKHHINYVQLSPLQESRLKQETDAVRKYDTQKWWLYYQPKSNELGNELHGTKQDIQDAINKFKSYNINVIADVVLGHLESNINYDDDNVDGIKYFNGIGLEALLIMAEIDIPYQIIIHLDEHINSLKYTFYDIFVNLEKNYGIDFIELENHRCGMNKHRELKRIFNECFKKYNPHRDPDTLITQEEVREIRADLIKLRNQIKNKICNYLKIGIEQFQNEYYDIITAPYNGDTINQVKWLSGLHKLNHNNKLVQEKTFEYLKELADIGILGLRFDYAIGFDPYILARYVEYFYRCVPTDEREKIYIYHEIIYYGHQISFRDNQKDSNLYKEELYRKNSNYNYSWNKNNREVAITSYLNLYMTRGLILSNNIKGLNGLSLQDKNDVVFSETHDTIFNTPFEQIKDNDWYNHRNHYGSEGENPLTTEKRIEVAMLMLCYFLSRSCRISLIYFNQIDFDDIFSKGSVSNEYYELYKPTKKSHDNVFKCLDFRQSLIENKIGNQTDEFDDNYQSIYISTKFVGSRDKLLSIYINFGDNDIYMVKDDIMINSKTVHIKCEQVSDVCKKLGIRIDFDKK